MADYYPLIARAIAGLDPSAPGESRRALYERARSALIAQLRSVEPPLSESEITRERLSLEEAVRKVESEAAQRARDATRDGSRAGGDRARAGDAFRANTRAATRGRRSGAIRRHVLDLTGARAAASARAAAIANERPPLGQEDRQIARSQRNRRTDPPRPRSQPPQIPMQDPQLPPTRERPARRAAAPKTAPRRPTAACAASATSPPMPTISAAPPRRPTAPRERPTPTCRRRRRSSTGSSRAWKIGAPIPRRPIPMTNRSRRPSATPPQQPATASALAACAGPRTEEAGSLRRGVSVQERDRDRHCADPGRRRDPVGQVGADDRQRPVQVVDHGGRSAKG